MMKRYILLTLIALTVAAAKAQERVMTIDEVDSLVTSNNLQLKASLLEVDAARAQLQQARKYDNPELQLMHNLQNPVNRKWLDTGHDGQTDILFSQPLAIGGQHRSRVRLRAGSTQCRTRQPRCQHPGYHGANAQIASVAAHLVRLRQARRRLHHRSLPPPASPLSPPA